MKGNFHVQFLGEGVAATSPPYPTGETAMSPRYPTGVVAGLVSHTWLDGTREGSRCDAMSRVS